MDGGLIGTLPGAVLRENSSVCLQYVRFHLPRITMRMAHMTTAIAVAPASKNTGQPNDDRLVVAGTSMEPRGEEELPTTTLGTSRLPSSNRDARLPPRVCR